MPFNPSAGQWGNEVGNPNRPNVYVIIGVPVNSVLDAKAYELLDVCVIF